MRYSTFNLLKAKYHQRKANETYKDNRIDADWKDVYPDEVAAKLSCVIGGLDRGMSGWGEAKGKSYAYWACEPIYESECEKWVRERGDISYVNTYVGLPPKRKEDDHVHVYCWLPQEKLSEHSARVAEERAEKEKTEKIESLRRAVGRMVDEMAEEDDLHNWIKGLKEHGSSYLTALTYSAEIRAFYIRHEDEIVEYVSRRLTAIESDDLNTLYSKTKIGAHWRHAYVWETPEDDEAQPYINVGGEYVTMRWNDVILECDVTATNTDNLVWWVVEQLIYEIYE